MALCQKWGPPLYYEQSRLPGKKAKQIERRVAYLDHVFANNGQVAVCVRFSKGRGFPGREEALVAALSAASACDPRCPILPTIFRCEIHFETKLLRRASDQLFYADIRVAVRYQRLLENRWI